MQPYWEESELCLRLAPVALMHISSQLTDYSNSVLCVNIDAIRLVFVGWPGGLEPHPAHHIEGSRREAMARAEVELPDLKWATLMFFLSLGIFPLGFYSVYTSDQYPLNPSVWLHWGHRSTLRSFSMGKALILFYSQARVLARRWAVTGADQLSPAESAASGPTALVFIRGEEPVGPGRTCFLCKG